MEIKIEEIIVQQKSVLIQLMELCNYDFSVYEDSDINECGYYGYSHIDDYWNEDGRFPYFIRVDGKLAGFALICRHCQFISDATAHSIAEFLILQKYRRNGIEKYVTEQVFSKH